MRSKLAALALACLVAVSLSGCGVHGLTGIWEQQHQTNQRLARISQQLAKIEKELAAWHPTKTR